MDPVCKQVDPPHIQYRKLKQWVQKNSKPKPVLKPPKIDRGPHFQGEGRLAELSKPKYSYIKPSRDPTRWEYILKHMVTEHAKNYVATARILELAVPLHITQKPSEKKIPLSALTYNASERIISLSLPRIPYKKWKPRRPVSTKALKYKASKRICSLAAHRKYESQMKESPYAINPVALKYYATKRIRRMARPKVPLTEGDLKALEEEHDRKKATYDEKRAAKLERKKQAIAQRHISERKKMGL